MTSWKTLAIVPFVFLLGGIQVPVQNETLVLEGGMLIDGRGGDPLADAVVVIQGPRIAAVGAREQVAYPRDARVINLEGRTILPGLIDPHIHLRDWMPQMFLHYGVTTAADTNNHQDWIAVQKAMFNSGKINGPRLFIAGMAAGGPGSDPTPINHPNESVEDVRAFIRNTVALGADMIKVNADLTSAQLSALLEEAARADRPVVGHSRHVGEATRLGLKFMEHTDPLVTAVFEQMDPERLRELEQQGFASPESRMDTTLFGPIIREMVEAGVYINPTLMSRSRNASPRIEEWTELATEIMRDPALEFVPASVRRSWTEPAARNPGAEGLRKVEEFIRRFVAAGGKIVAGTDAGYIPGLSLHFEMQMIADSGVPPMSAILSATRWAAEAIGQDDQIGTLEVGKLADITVVDGTPLDDIAATRDIYLVIKDGQVVDRTYDPTFVNPVPRPVDVDPEFSSLSPRTARAGDERVTLRIRGAGFNARSVVRFDTTDLETQLISPSELTAELERPSLEAAGSYPVTVVNPGSGGGVSRSIYFIVGL